MSYNDMMNEMLDDFDENYGFLSILEPFTETPNISKDQLELINISEHNRLEAYFIKYFSEEEYKKMPFYQLAQSLNYRDHPTDRLLSVDCYKEINIGMIMIMGVGLTIVPKMIDLMNKCKAAILMHTIEKADEMKIIITGKLFPDDKHNKRAK